MLLSSCIHTSRTTLHHISGNGVCSGLHWLMLLLGTAQARAADTHELYLGNAARAGSGLLHAIEEVDHFLLGHISDKSCCRELLFRFALARVTIESWVRAAATHEFYLEGVAGAGSGLVHAIE